jgi:hypothetical protein
LKRAFKLALKQGLTSLGYAHSCGTIFVREVLPGVLGTIGYLTAERSSQVKPFVGVKFEHVEKIYDELVSPFLFFPTSMPRDFPTCFRSLYDLKEEHSADPDFRLKERSYLPVRTDNISSVIDQVLLDVRQYGIHYIEFNATLTNAASTMAGGHGGGIGTVAYKLPIIYWILGHTDEAKRYMVRMAAQGYHLGDYENYAAILTARIDAGPAPQQP